MATYLWSTLVNGRVISPFDPNVDVLRFDDTSISAAAVYGDFYDSSPTVNGSRAFTLTYGGKTVTVQMNPQSITTSNVIFGNGSRLLVGDNAANTLTGGSGNDQFFGLGGDDSLSGGSGDDLFTMGGDNITGVLGNDTIAGGDAKDYMYFPQNARVGINVDFSIGFSAVSGILGTITGGDSMPGQGVPIPTIISTVSASGIEAVIGTNLADTFTASSLTPISGLSTDIAQIFDGAGGNDTISGATGDGRITMLSYQNAPSGVSVHLGTGTASDGLGGTDTFSNIDGVRGSLFNDTLTGGSSSRTMTGGLYEFFEGMAGNDTIDGGGGADTSIYSGNRAAYTITKTSTGYTVSGGADGTDTLTGIEVLQFADQSIRLDKITASSNTGDVIGAYFSMFGRAPEPSGLQYWQGQLGTSFPALGKMIDNWLSLSIVKANGYPDGQSIDSFIAAIYQNVFNKAPDDGGYWKGQSAGMSRGDLAATILGAAKGVPAGAPGKTYIDNKIAGATQIVDIQYAYGKDLTPTELTNLLKQVGTSSASIQTAGNDTVAMLGAAGVAGLAGVSTFTDTWLL